MTSISGYARDKIYTFFEDALRERRYEEACHWLVELDLSSWLNDWWVGWMIPWLASNIYEHNPKVGFFVQRMSQRKQPQAKWIADVVAFAMYTPKSRPLAIRKVNVRPFLPYLHDDLISTTSRSSDTWVHLASILLKALQTRAHDAAFRAANLLYSHDPIRFGEFYVPLMRFVIARHRNELVLLMRCWHSWRANPLVMLHLVAILTLSSNWDACASGPEAKIADKAEKRMHYLYQDIQANARQIETKEKGTKSTKNELVGLEKMDVAFGLVDGATYG